MEKEFLDSRDLEEEIKEYLQEKSLSESQKEELKELQDLKEECEGYGWEYGITFIAEWYFDDYAEELFDDCYSHNIPDNLKCYIDYKRFSSDLERDYSSVTFRGKDYLYREA